MSAKNSSFCRLIPRLRDALNKRLAHRDTLSRAVRCISHDRTHKFAEDENAPGRASPRGASKVKVAFNRANENDLTTRARDSDSPLRVGLIYIRASASGSDKETRCGRRRLPHYRDIRRLRSSAHRARPYRVHGSHSCARIYTAIVLVAVAPVAPTLPRWRVAATTRTTHVS